jgi:hypothetical protein
MLQATLKLVFSAALAFWLSSSAATKSAAIRKVREDRRTQEVSNRTWGMRVSRVV